MGAAVDKIAGFAAHSPLSRVTLRRDKSPGFIALQARNFSKSVREWGYDKGLYEHRLKGRHPVQLLGSPDDPAPGNAMLGSAIFGGDLMHRGEQHKLSEAFWLEIGDNASPVYKAYAHSFHWLQDLAQTHDQAKAQQAAETIISWWLPVGETWHRDIWAAETIARRLINWLSHAPLIFSTLDLVYRSKVLHSMAQQTRHLMRVHKDANSGLGHLYTASALTMAGLLLPGGKNWLLKGLKLLEVRIKNFILPDGSPISRNPADAIRTMQLLILVRNSFIDTNSDLPSWVQITLDKLAPFVRALRHMDGSFAQFNGVSAEGSFGVDAILAASEAKGKPIENASHAGVQRIVHENSCLIVDCGPPPPKNLSAQAHAGTAAFEFSTGQDRLVVNMGPANLSGDMAALNKLSRATAAHSTLVISDNNSSQITNDGYIARGVTESLVLRESIEDATSIKLMHNGYLKRYGVKHERTLTLASSGKKLSGSDKLFGPKLKKLNGETVTLRFHLHPSVEALKAPDGRITLETKNKHIWIFDVDGGQADLEESLYLKKPDSPANSRQILVHIPVQNNTTPICKWEFNEMDI